jgi:hypothetical protein
MPNIQPKGAIDREIDAAQQRIDKLTAERQVLSDRIQSVTTESKTGTLQREAIKTIALTLLLTTIPTLLWLVAACPAIGQTECSDRTSSSLLGCDR